MEKFYKKKCIACDNNTIPFDKSEISKYRKKIDGWNLKDNKGKNYYLEKKFKFKNFIDSEKFIRSVGLIAELEGHHPDICFGWGYVRIKIFTHAVKGLTESDFILAAKIDQI